MDNEQKKLVAEKIRALLEGRVSRLLGCQPSELPYMKIGSMAHFLFLLVGDAEVMPGFNTAMGALRDLIGFDLMWAKAEEDEAEKKEVVVVIN